MKRRNAIMLALAVLLMAPMQLVAQGGGGAGGARGGMGGGMGGFGMARALVDQGSVDFLLTKSADLQLTADQSTKLKAVAAKWAESTKDARATLKESLPQPGQGMGGGDREAMMQRLQAARPHMEKLTTEDAAAVEAAMALLTDAQKPQAKKLLEERQQSMMPRRGGGGGGGGR